MCFGGIRQYLIPNDELKRRLVFVKIICLVNFLIAFLRLVIGDPMSMIYDFINVFILYMAFSSVFFMFMGMYILFAMLNSFYLIVAIGLVIQLVIQKTRVMEDQDYIAFGINLFILCFYIFSIVFNFAVYKEMKAQFQENILGGGSGQQGQGK